MVCKNWNRYNVIVVVFVEKSFEGSQIHCRITFASVSEKLCATSLYMGEIGVIYFK